MLPVLRRTCSMLHATARRYASHAPPPSKDAQHHTVFSTRLSLPTPEPLVARLMMLGIDKSSAEQVSSLLARAIVRLKDSFEADYQRRLETLRPRAQYFQDSKFSTSFSATYLTIYTKTVRSWAEYLLHDVTPRLIRAQAQHRAEDNSTNTHHRRPFNQGAIPILEQTFSRNPFPTRLEKYDLAFQCDMEYRQIHVWFQNRRSRLRKDGKELKKPVPRDRLLQDIEDSIVVSLFPHCAEDGDDKDDDDWSSVRHDLPPLVDTFSAIPVPSHAYPTPYPPPLDEADPFPADPKQRMLQLPWIRTPASSPSPTTTVDMSQLISSFAQLTLDDESATSATFSTPSPASSDRGFTTYCYPAPHPAFLPRNVLELVTSPCCRSKPRQRSRVKRLVNTSPVLHGDNERETLPPTSSSPSLRAKRSLPRRIPKHPPSLPSLPPPSQSTERFMSSTSRTPSCSSLSSSYSVSGSDVDSPLSTPILAPADVALPPFVCDLDHIAAIDISAGKVLADYAIYTSTDLSNPYP